MIETLMKAIEDIEIAVLDNTEIDGRVRIRVGKALLEVQKVAKEMLANEDV